MSPSRPRKRRNLLLVFRLPENPSRYRVSVWRRLKRAGARAIHRTLFLLPDTPLNRLRAADLAHDVENWGGSAWVFAGNALTTPMPSGTGLAYPEERDRPLGTRRAKNRR